MVGGKKGGRRRTDFVVEWVFVRDGFGDCDDFCARRVAGSIPGCEKSFFSEKTTVNLHKTHYLWSNKAI